MDHYSQQWLRNSGVSAQESAKIIVPLILQLLRPSSVVDVGCGTGMWLSVFRKEGVEDIIGVDGDWASRGPLLIPREKFVAHDLKDALSLDRRFDLAVSLEVAEHLPEASAGAFVRSLTQLAPAVVFSAAIPFQGGRHHVNEQWPHYWAQLFHREDYVAVDCLRGEVWRNPDVAFWYAQNMLLFVRRDQLRQPVLRDAHERTNETMLSLVHPEQYLRAASLNDLVFRRFIPGPMRRVGKFVLKQLRRSGIIADTKNDISETHSS